ncbi:MAG: polysaccharide biosynthesis tyrosine autokinase [Chthoniobacterales bacterium]
MTISPGTDATAEGLNAPEKAEQLRTRFIRYKNVLFGWWWIPALTLSAGLCLQGWLVLSKPIQYQSAGRIIVSGKVSLPEGSVFSEEVMNFFGTQQELMQSAEVQRRATATVQSLRPDLEPIPVQLAVSYIPRTAIFQLNVTGSSPEYVQAYLDAIMEQYIALRRSMVSEKSQSTLSAITEELSRLQTELDKGQDELFEWQKKNNSILLQEEGNSAGKYLADLKRQLAALQTQYRLLETLSLDQNLDRASVQNSEVPTAADRSSNARGIDSQLIDNVVSNGPVAEYLRARQQLYLLEAENRNLSETYRDDHPVMIAEKKKIVQQQKLIEILKEQSAEQFESRKNALRIEIETKKTDIAVWEDKALDLSKRMGEFERLKAKVDRLKALYEKLVASVQNVDVNANIQQDVVSIMEYASAPGEIRPPLIKEMFMGGFGGLALGFGILVLIGILDDRIVSISELQSVFDEEVVGVIPKTNFALNPVLHDDDDRQQLVEAFRTIRSWIFFTPWEGRPPKTFLITSSIPEEGKSTISSNLAVALASSGSETLLVDSDLRRGSVHKLFGIESEPGLGDVLSGEVNVESALVTGVARHLSILPRGRMVSRGTELYLGKAFEKFLQDVYSKFDYIIFDSCPMLAVDDTSTIAPKVDAVFFVIRSSFTGIRLARKALSLLEARRANVQGIIYNSVEWGATDYPYYKYEYASKTDKKEKPVKS